MSSNNSYLPQEGGERRRLSLFPTGFVCWLDKRILQPAQSLLSGSSSHNWRTSIPQDADRSQQKACVPSELQSLTQWLLHKRSQSLLQRAVKSFNLLFQEHSPVIYITNTEQHLSDVFCFHHCCSEWHHRSLYTCCTALHRCEQSDQASSLYMNEWILTEDVAGANFFPRL